MRVTILWLAVLVVLLSGVAANGQAVAVVGNDANYHTDLLLYNPTNATIEQLIGVKTFRDDSGATTTVTKKINLAPGETACIVEENANFDKTAGHQILPLQPGLAVAAWLRFRPEVPGNPSFEVQALNDPLTQPGSFRVFHMVRIDDVRRFGAFPTILNLDSVPHDVTARIMPAGASTATTERFPAPPGVSQFPITTDLPNGGDVEIYLGSPGFGGAPIPKPVYVFLPTGPTDGGTQIIRYGVMP